MTKEERADTAIAVMKAVGMVDYRIISPDGQTTGGKEAAVALFEAGYALASNQWVKCDGEADYRAEEEWVWVALPNGTTQLATWAERWEGPADDDTEFTWLEGEFPDMLSRMNPQPTHFQPKPTAP